MCVFLETNFQFSQNPTSSASAWQLEDVCSLELPYPFGNMERNQCNCSFDAIQSMSTVLSQNILSLDIILQTGCEFLSHLRTTIDCEQCLTADRMLSTVSQAASRLVDHYESAYLSTSDQRSKFFDQDSTQTARNASDTSRILSPALIQPQSFQNPVPAYPSPRTPTCLLASSDIRFGQFSIDRSEAQVLARVVLADKCLDLNEALQDLKVIVDEMLERTADSCFVQCKAVVGRCLNRLARLTGQLQLDTSSRASY